MPDNVSQLHFLAESKYETKGIILQQIWKGVARTGDEVLIEYIYNRLRAFIKIPDEHGPMDCEKPIIIEDKITEEDK